MASHPYSDLPDYAYWRRAVGAKEGEEIDPVVDVPFRFGPKAAVATAGSCFAQHIGRYLKANGCNFLVTEPAHPMVGPKAQQLLGYGVFTARYGNVYTSRQLLQLFDRAYGRFLPSEDIWREADDIYIDPFRPNIQPRGFNSEKELAIDRDRHFCAVRNAFETLDVFVFTLGLTEAWISRADGAVFPLCPGVSGGVFSKRRHEFLNLEVADVIDDMQAFIARLRGVNRKARIILTVSPVPLAATAEPRHVLSATVYSKSVLRVACEMLSRSLDDVAYFPSYEIIASGVANNYFAADKRSITENGVAHVMTIFSRHFLNDSRARGVLRRATEVFTGAPAGVDRGVEAVLQAMRVMCDEEALDAIPGIFGENL